MSVPPTHTFIHSEFLLNRRTSSRLFHEVAEALPIIDYHCHLDADQLERDHRFENIAELWLLSDPYKHRAMRIAGVPESQITGEASDREKFNRWAETVPLTLGNPLHHWTALELSRYFGIDEPLNAKSADRIWDLCHDQLANGLSAQSLLLRANVATVCTSDQLGDDLSAHAKIASSDLSVQILPSLRSDDLLAVDRPNYLESVLRWGNSVGIEIKDWDSFVAAVQRCLDHFDTLGCRLSDHALDDFEFDPIEPAETARLWEQCFSGTSLSQQDRVRLQSGLLLWLGKEYAERRWVLQLHLGAQRQTSSRLRSAVGPAGGYASMGNASDIPALCALLDRLELDAALPRTILYPLNPILYPALATLTGSFPGDGVPGKIQLGPAWWYNDHYEGIHAQLDALASHGLLSLFIGMTTDSRSLLSIARHEYFRRIFCDWIGHRVDSGYFPNNDELLTPLVESVCYGNAFKYILNKE